MKVQLTETESIKISVVELADEIYRFAHRTMTQDDWLEWLNSDTAYEYQGTLNPLIARTIRNGSANSFRDSDGNVKPEILAECAIDCRLRAFEGSSELSFGLSDYDQDHRGYWAYNSIPYGCTREQSRAIARELIEGLE